MEIPNRSAHPQAAGPSGQSVNNSVPRRSSSNAGDNDKWSRIGLVAGLFALAVILTGVIALSVADNNDAKNSSSRAESSYIDTKKLQAVFLNTGQVYFGNLKSLNSQHATLANIYYLQTSGNAANNANPNVTLVKLGCELHRPDDLMVINRDQITFWENLGDNGQVAQAVANFKRENPPGQKCADQSSAAPANSGNAAQNANGNNAAGNNTGNAANNNR